MTDSEQERRLAMRVEYLEAIRKGVSDLYDIIMANVPDAVEREIALKELGLARYWANVGIMVGTMIGSSPTPTFSSPTEEPL